MEEVFTKTCSKCKIEQPVSNFHKNKPSSDGLHPWCKSCRKNNAAKRYASDPDKYREMNRVSYRKRVGPPRKVMTEEERMMAQRESTRRWIGRNLERVREYRRKYYYANRLKIIEYAEQYRTKKAGQRVGDVSISDVYRDNYELYGEVTCIACGKTQKEVRASGKRMHVDHIWPLNPRDGEPGGEHVQDNLCILCQDCNLSKSNGNPVRFLTRKWTNYDVR